MTKTKTKTKVLKKPVATKAKDATKKTLTQKVVIRRELDYIYPKGMIDPLERKSFRSTVRNTIRKMARDILKLKGKSKLALQIKFKAYYAKHRTKPY